MASRKKNRVSGCLIVAFEVYNRLLFEAIRDCEYEQFVAF